MLSRMHAENPSRDHDEILTPPAPLDWRTESPLVLERSAFMRSILTSLLRDAGAADVMAAPNQEMALQAMHDFPPSVLIMDWPAEDESAGDRIRFIRRIRETERAPYRDVPIILVTHPRTRREVEIARDVGATEFLVTPLAPTVLRQRLQSLEEKPRNFVDASRYRGPCRRRRPRREDGPAYKRVADVSQGLTTPIQAARAAALSLAQETVLSGDKLAIRVGRSLQHFIATIEDYTASDAEVVDMHRAALAKLVRMAEMGNPLREPVVKGLEEVVELRTQKR